MAFDDPTAVDGYPLSSLEWRRSQAGLLAHASDPQSALPGVLAGFACTVSGTTLTYGVGSAVVTPSSGANGSYLAVAGTSGTVAFVANDPTYARIDRVVLRVYDTAVDGSGQTKAAIEIIQGTAAASPVAPTLPAGRLELYQAQVPAGSGAITLVDRRVYTASAGGQIIVPTAADLPSGSHLRVGQRATDSAGAEYRYNGTAWKLWNEATWHTVPLASGFAHISTEYTFMYRMQSGKVVFKGGLSSAGITATGSHVIVAVGGIPVDYRPNPSKFAYAASSSIAAAGRYAAVADGSMELLASASVGTFYLGDAISYVPGT